MKKNKSNNAKATKMKTKTSKTHKTERNNTTRNTQRREAVDFAGSEAIEAGSQRAVDLLGTRFENVL